MLILIKKFYLVFSRNLDTAIILAPVKCDKHTMSISVIVRNIITYLMMWEFIYVCIIVNSIFMKNKAPSHSAVKKDFKDNRLMSFNLSNILIQQKTCGPLLKDV